MPNKMWFLNIRGETFGPIGTNVVLAMLKQNRLQFTDFLWSEGLTRWMRIQDLHEFASLMPAYPTSPIPAELPDYEADRDDGLTGDYKVRGGQITPVHPVYTPPVPPTPVTSLPQAVPAAKVGAALPTPPPAEEALRPAKKVGAINPKAKFRRNARVPFEAHVTVHGHGLFQSIDLSGGGLLLQGPKGIRISTDVKFRIEAGPIDKILEMTGVVVREEVCGGHVEFAIEFTRVNPAHKRIIQDYVTQKLSEAA